MHKSKPHNEDDAEDFGEEIDSDSDADELHFDDDESGGSQEENRDRHRPARQRLESRNEQKSLRAQLSDWDDYD